MRRVLLGCTLYFLGQFSNSENLAIRPKCNFSVESGSIVLIGDILYTTPPGSGTWAVKLCPPPFAICEGSITLSSCSSSSAPCGYNLKDLSVPAGGYKVYLEKEGGQFSRQIIWGG